VPAIAGGWRGTSRAAALLGLAVLAAMVPFSIGAGTPAAAAGRHPTPGRQVAPRRYLVAGPATSAAGSAISVGISPVYSVTVPPGSWAPETVTVSDAGPGALHGRLLLRSSVPQLVQPGSQVCYSSAYGATVCSAAAGSYGWYAYGPLTGSAAGNYSGGTSDFVTYSIPLDISPGTTKQLIVDVLTSSAAGSIQAKVLAADGRLLASSTSQLPIAPATASPAVLVVTGNETALSATSLPMPDGHEPQVQLLPPAAVPSGSAVLDGFAAVVVDEADTSQLTSAQGEALEGYVRAGGLLVVAGGLSWRLAVAGLPAALLPAKVVGTTALALPRLGRLLGVTAPAGEVATDRLSPAPGARPILAEGTVPLAFQLGMGNGSAVLSALDPAAAPLSDWQGEAALMSRLLASAFQNAYYNEGTSVTPGGRVISTVPVSAGYSDQPAELSSLMSPAVSSGALGGFLEQMPGASLPGPSLLGALLLGYVAVIGPLSFLLLRRSRRRKAAWVALPSFAIVAAVVAYATGTGMYRGPLSDQVQVAVLTPGSHLAELNSLGAVYLPRGGSSDVVLAGAGAVTDLGAGAGGALTVESTNGVESSRLVVKGGDNSLGGWAESQDIDVTGTVDGESWQAGGEMVGWVKNDLGVPLKDAYVVEAYVESSDLGALAPGASASFRLPIPSQQPGGVGVGAPLVGNPFLATVAGGGFAAARQQAAVQGLSELGSEFSGAAGGPVLVALAARPFLPGDQVDARSSAVDAVIVPLQPGERTTSAISGLSPELVGSQGLTSAPGPLASGELELARAGALYYQFVLPSGQWHKMVLNVGSPDGAAQALGSTAVPGLSVATVANPGVPAPASAALGDFSLSAFDFADGSWVGLASRASKGQFVATVPRPGRFVGPGGVMEVRLKAAVAGLEVFGAEPTLFADPASANMGSGG